MARLSLSVLGSFRVSLDQQPVTGFESNKVRALLVYLMVEADRPHSRDALIGLLWPDRPEPVARSNLSQALANLRKAVGDTSPQSSFLHITRDTIQMKRDSDYELDVAAFQALLTVCKQHAHRRLETCRSCAQRLQQAVELYRGDFLAHFSVPAGEAFDEWATIQRERLHQEALDALYHLTQHFEWRGDYVQALQHAQRQLELDPWREEAHRQAMRAMALTEQRSAALAQYEACRRILAEELGAEPAEETTALYEQIKAGTVLSHVQRRQWFIPSTHLIGREPELAEANAIWHKARTGEGQVLLISGEPGIGKTRLIHELIAQERYSNATVLLGECYAEGSTPYAPITQIIQAALNPHPYPPPSANSMDRGGDTLPLSNLFSTGEGQRMGTILADLITFVPELHDRFPNVQPNPPLEPQAEQQRRFDSVAKFFAVLAAHAPLMLIIEDAHWADSATLSLLRHIARRLRQARVLIVTTYREAAVDEMRLFHEWLGDLQRERLSSSIHLVRLDKEHTRDLLAALFREPIAPDFLDGIYNATEGNPFFVTEVCQALIDEGAVYREGERWQHLGMAQIQIPPSVRLAIRRRVDRLTEATQDSLQRAALLGREFEFDVLQAMSDLDEEALIEALEMAERARLIDEVPRTSRAARLSFAFVHALIPTTLREGLNSLRRQRLHRRAAEALERIHPDRLDELAAQLGRHYAEAGESEKAIAYLLRAGDQARGVYAYDEAIEHYQQALAFLKNSGPGELSRAARTAMNLGGLYHTMLNFEQAQQAYGEAFDLWQHASEALAPALPPAPHALRGYLDEIRTFDLTLVNDWPDGTIVQQLFSGLVETTPDFDIVPVLAHRWEILDGGRRYVFHLRRDARWSDGQPVTARDFDCAWRRLLDPATHSPNAECLYPIKNARALHQGKASPESLGIHMPDNFTLVVELAEPTGYFMQLLAFHATFAIPYHSVEAYGAAWCEAEHLVTNGPFRLTEWVRGDKLILTQNPDYCGRFSGNLARVELTLMPLNKTTLDKYDAGKHDICFSPGVDMISQVRQQRAREYVSAPPATTYCIGFDATCAPFDDTRVRQAFVHAVDRRTLAEVIQHHVSTAATGGFVPPGLPGHSAHIGLPYDPERARRLLAEAGYPQGRGFPNIVAWAPRGIDDRLYSLQAQWREQLGVEIMWQIFEWNAYKERQATHTSQLFTFGWVADYPDPDTFLRVALHQQHWHNEQYEQLLETARRVNDPVERLKFYQAADRLLVQEAGIMPLIYVHRHLLIKPWVKRYPISALDAYYWKDVIMEGH